MTFRKEFISKAREFIQQVWSSRAAQQIASWALIWIMRLILLYILVGFIAVFLGILFPKEEALQKVVRILTTAQIAVAGMIFSFLLSVTLYAFLIGVILALPWLVWWVPRRQIPFSVLDPKDRVGLENELRRTLAQILGGVVILVGLYSTWKTVNISQEGQITDRFTKAIGQLGESGSEKLAIRLGGIYALERIARDSERDYWPIVEILIAYIRSSSPLPSSEKQPSTILSDIQAILTVFGRRTRIYGMGEDQGLDLSRTNLRGARCREINLQMANLNGSFLEGADLTGAHLQFVDFRGANLKEAKLSDAHLEGADLSGAHLEWADLSGAYLGGTSSIIAKFTEVPELNDLTARLIRQKKIDFFDQVSNKLYEKLRTNLSAAYLEGANLSAAHLGGADLDGTHLEKTNLSLVYSLTQDQLNHACGDEETQVPEGLKKPQPCKKDSKKEDTK